MTRFHAPGIAQTALRTTARFFRSGLQLARGRKLMYPSFASASLDSSDAGLVHELLQREEEWRDESCITDWENSFAEWNQSDAAVAFGAGRVALSAAIEALQLKPGDEVIVPNYTCVVVPNAFLYAGICMRFCDVELQTFGPDIDSLRKQLTRRTRAVLVQHTYGLVCRDFEQIVDLTQAKAIHLIEDCAHAMGAVFQGRKVGNWGAIGFYSTEHTKVISSQRGGVAVSNDPALAARLRDFQRNCAAPSAAQTRSLLLNTLLSYYSHRDPRRWLLMDYYRLRYRNECEESTSQAEIHNQKPAGYLARMPAPLARLALKQLRKADALNAARRRTAERWSTVCTARSLPTVRVTANSVPVFLRYPVLVPDGKKQDLAWCIDAFGVHPGIWFSGEWHPANHALRDCPNARYAVDHCINLPTLM